MPLPTWPTGFPIPQREGYSYSLPELNGRTDFQLGARTRPLYADGGDTFTASVELDLTQWAYLQGWFRYEINNGASWFTLTLQAAGTLATREVRFTTGALQFEPFSPTDVRVSLPLETRTGTTMTRAEWDALNP